MNDAVSREGFGKSSQQPPPQTLWWDEQLIEAHVQILDRLCICIPSAGTIASVHVYILEYRCAAANSNATTPGTDHTSGTGKTKDQEGTLDGQHSVLP